MFDPDQVPLSTSAGRRPPSTAGDRMMVGLAMLALMGGLLIAVSRLIPAQTDQTSQATATPVLRDEPPIPRSARAGPYVSEWVRLRIGVTLLQSPTSARTTGRLHPGEPAYITDAPREQGGFNGWLHVDGPVSGWIFGEIGNDAMFERFPSDRGACGPWSLTCDEPVDRSTGSWCSVAAGWPHRSSGGC